MQVYIYIYNLYMYHTWMVLAHICLSFFFVGRTRKGGQKVLAMDSIIVLDVFVSGCLGFRIWVSISVQGGALPGLYI